MRGAEDDARERELASATRDRPRAWSSEVSRSSRTRFSSFCGKRRPQRHVGHDRQRVAQPRHRHVEAARPTRRTSSRSTGRRRGSRPRRRSASASRVPAPSSSIVGRQARDAELAGRIVAAAGLHDQIDLHERHLVQLDDPDRQAVRQRPLLNRRQLQRAAAARARAASMRSGALLRDDRGDGRRAQHDERAASIEAAFMADLSRPARHFFTPAPRRAPRADPAAATNARRPGCRARTATVARQILVEVVGVAARPCSRRSADRPCRRSRRRAPCGDRTTPRSG